MLRIIALQKFRLFSRLVEKSVAKKYSRTKKTCKKIKSILFFAANAVYFKKRENIAILLAFPFGVCSPDKTGEMSDKVWQRGGVRRRGEVDFASKANKRRERSCLLKHYEYCLLFTLVTSIDGYAATLPTERAPFVALRHFPRFIGEIYPKGESKILDKFCIAYFLFSWLFIKSWSGEMFGN